MATNGNGIPAAPWHGAGLQEQKTTDQEDKGGGRWRQNIKGHPLFSDVISLLL